MKFAKYYIYDFFLHLSHFNICMSVSETLFYLNHYHSFSLQIYLDNLEDFAIFMAEQLQKLNSFQIWAQATEKQIKLNLIIFQIHISVLIYLIGI